MVLLILLLNTILTGLAATQPTNPCPNNFQYQKNERNEIYGIMSFKNDFSGNYKVELKMAVPMQTNQNIKILRKSSLQDVQSGKNILYHVIFPRIPEVPEVDEIRFNGHVYCSFPHSFGTGVTALTFLSAYNTFSVVINVQPITSQGNTDQSFHQHRPIIPQENSEQFMFHHHRPTISQENSNQFMYHQPELENNQNTNFINPSTVTNKPQYNGPNFFETLFPTSKPTTQVITMNPPPVNINNREGEECGIAIDTQALVVHGTLTSENQHPWLVAMFHLQESEKYKFKCAANLITHNHVITAAHCVRNPNKPENLPHEAITLVLGKHNIKTWATRSEIRDVKEIYVHPDYNKPSDADIAIVTMYKSVEFTQKIRAICLWSERTTGIVGSKGTVVGWGRDEFFNEYSPEPKQISMPVVSQEDCLRSDERFLKLTSNRTFCAGSRDGSGLCTGDSGGGFVMKRGERWTLRGIVSSALVDSSTRSCDVNNYMVFVDVVKHKRWIERVLNL